MTSFNLINFQETLASKMLGLRSFQRKFAQDPMSRAGMSQQGRRRTKRKAIEHLMSIGYSDASACQIVQDAQDHAELLYHAR